MNSKSKLLFLIISIVVSGCTTLGTKTLFKATGTHSINSIGFSKLQEAVVLEKICPETEEIFQQSVPTPFNESGITNVKYINEELDYESPNITRLKELCAQNQVEAILITKLKFVHVTYSAFMVPIAQNYDTEVETKLIDKNGNLLFNTMYNTLKGNSYMMAPTAEKTVKDGVTGAINRIIKEMGLKKNKSKTVANNT
ncbi:MAG: hypothetical protein ACO1OQ_03160 [Rufibacter sp.]